MDNERHYEQLVYVRSDGKSQPQNTGLQAYVRVRFVHTLRNQNGEPRLSCMDSVRLYGVGASGRLSRIELAAGQFEPCDQVVWAEGAPPPLARWDVYLNERVLPDRQMEMKPVRPLKGRQPIGYCGSVAGIHKPQFP